jgi:hypothetical protein
MHYRRWQRHGSTDAPARTPRTTCAVEGCADFVKFRIDGQALCGAHGKRKRRNGTTDLIDRRTPAAERLSALYTRAGRSACWPWRGSIDTTGYGRFRLDDGRLTTAHRAVYEHHVGPITVGLTLDHLCRNRQCVNPHHLEPVTQAVNNSRRVVDQTRCRSAGHANVPDLRTG